MPTGTEGITGLKLPLAVAYIRPNERIQSGTRSTIKQTDNERMDNRKGSKNG